MVLAVQRGFSFVCVVEDNDQLLADSWRSFQPDCAKPCFFMLRVSTIQTGSLSLMETNE